VESEHRQPIGEVGVRELSRDTSGVLRDVRDHERIIVTRHGHPIAVVLSVAACIDLVVAEEVRLPRRREQRARLKRDLLARLLGPDIAGAAADRRLRRVSRMLGPLPPGAQGFHGH
jgi:prevent-host-death family protein